MATDSTSTKLGKRSVASSLVSSIATAQTAPNSLDYSGETSATTAQSILREFMLACVVGASDAIQRRSSVVEVSTSYLPESVSILSRLAELKAWLQEFDGVDAHEEAQEKIQSFARWQVQNNFQNFARSIQDLAPTAADSQVDALAQLLIASSDEAKDYRAYVLGSSIEPYLENNEPLLIDAAAKALSKSRLDFKHAAKRIESVARKTKFRYLRRQLQKVADQLEGRVGAEVRSEA